jgi:hypothetical protein
MKTITKQQEALKVIVQQGAESILKGTLPKVVKYGFLNKGFTEELADKIMSLILKEANQFSHYKIGGKNCQENKNQRY